MTVGIPKDLIKLIKRLPLTFNTIFTDLKQLQIR